MRLLKTLLVFLLLTVCQPVVAADDGRNYSLDEMASRIQQQTGSEILSAEVKQTRQGVIYRFKVKKEGRVRVLAVHPDGSPANSK